ncbi:MAG TPA: ABC transporter substrate-binding protein [Anaerolineales bacterium]|nr:ABC transporter substrate-binding protein [Anaerolineales bacterium]
MTGKNNPRKIWSVLTWIIIATLVLSGCGNSKAYRVGILSSNQAFAAIEAGFKAKMTELGYIENENIVYVIQTTDPGATPEQRQDLLRKLVEDKVDLIFVSGSPDAVAAKVVTQGTDIPVVFAYGQLEGTNLVNSVREPGGNMTGVRYPGAEMISKRLSIMLQIVPDAKRVWIGYNKNGPNTATALEALRPTASSLGVTLVEVPATQMEELTADLAARAQLSDPGIDAIITMPDEFNTSTANFELISKFAAEHKIPLAGGIGFMANQGALFVNSTNLTNVGALAAPVADKILKGAPAGTLPVITPEQTLVINYSMAQQLGLNLSESLLKMADEVIR